VTSTPLHAWADAAASAEIAEIDGRRVVAFRVAGGKHHGAIGINGSATVERAVRLAGELHLPLVGEFDTSGAELRDGVAALHAWGRLARELVQISGVVPTLLAVTGACVSGPALALGLFDHVVMTEDAFAYVTGPDSVEDFTGVRVSRAELGGSAVHAQRTGVASLVVPDHLAARDALAAILWYLPDHHLDDPARLESDDPRDRLCDVAATAVPRRSSASYDVRTVVDDVLDHDSFLELRPRFAPNLVTGYGSLGGRAVGIVANQPMTRAGTLDIEASRKAARFVAACDAFNLPIVTFVDTPGFEPGRDLEWRGMIRHGAELVHAYSAATVPRLCVVLRKAYGGAYIVMDSRGIGNDLCVAWPSAEIAVMGAAGAVAILNKGRTDPELVAEYRDAFENPYRAAERGFVDAVIEPASTRRVLVDTLEMLADKRDSQPARRHSNTPL
jgi:acetyl-CoA carboxylase carboxyltransferase component